MTTHHNSSIGCGNDPVVAALRVATVLEQKSEPGATRARTTGPFITISRQAGAGGHSLGRCLVDRLNARERNGPAWTLWDDDLVQKVATEEAIAQAYVESLEDTHHGWLRDFLHGLTFGDADQHPSEFKVYDRVARTIRELATMGRAVIVGRGGAFVTAGMPGGVRLRLVAPLDYRVRVMASRLNVTEEEAAIRVREVDHNRATFIKRYWPQKALEPESFTITLNPAAIGSVERMADCVLPLVVSASGCAGAGCGCKRKNAEAVPAL